LNFLWQDFAILKVSSLTMKVFLLLIFFPVITFSQSRTDLMRCEKEAQMVTVIRDTWGVPHIYGKTDANAVFGLLYTECEDNFKQVEENNLEMLGRIAEVYGQQYLYSDLQMRLIYDTAKAIRDYRQSPGWLRALCDAAADGVNYYLYTHPQVKPALLFHFYPWYALLRTNGSISATQTGGITLGDMKGLYPADNRVAYVDKQAVSMERDPTGSNGFAVSPSKTQSGNAILYINPHVTFYYRSEVQMVSDQGLDVYGAVTWGTFFVFQGFNQYCGWMHTSGETDVADLFKEVVVTKRDTLFTKYGPRLLPVTARKISIRYTKDGAVEEKKFTTYYSVHGPVMGIRNGVWLSLRENNRSMKALMQSWLRTKTKGFASFKEVMNLRSNTSDNTVFADNRGNIAYWHGNFVPHRNNLFDYSQPVDGSTPLSDWKGSYPLDAIVHVVNPATGFIQNCNSTPFSVSGKSSPKKVDYPVYMAPDGENFRAINAVKLLSEARDLTVDRMIRDIGYNHHLTAFDWIIPALLHDFDSLPSSDTMRLHLQEAIALLRVWNKYSSDTSVATALAIELGYRLFQTMQVPAGRFTRTDAVGQLEGRLSKRVPGDLLVLLDQTLNDLAGKFGTWKISWGAINRYQRTADGLFDDRKPSLPVGLGSSLFGSIPSFASRRFPHTIERYGTAGNSFVACVEFGKRVTAKSIVTGGQSSDPSSKHFSDQSQMFIDGNFKDVLFYKEDVLKHLEKSYHPGQ